MWLTLITQFEIIVDPKILGRIIVSFDVLDYIFKFCENWIFIKIYWKLKLGEISNHNCLEIKLREYEIGAQIRVGLHHDQKKKKKKKN